MENNSLAIDFYIGVVLLGLGAWLLAYLLKHLTAPFIQLFSNIAADSHIRKRQENLGQIAALIEQENYKEALGLIEKSFVFRTFPRPNNAQAVRDIHRYLLSQCLIIADEIGGDSSLIALVEQLFEQKLELETLLLKAEENYFRIRSKRDAKGQSLPSWTSKEYADRRSEITIAIAQNHEQLMKNLSLMLKAISEERKPDLVIH